MKLFYYFYHAYPSRTIISCFAITIAGLIGGISISALLPLLSKAFSSSNQQPDTFDKLFAQLNIDPSLEVLVIVVIAGIILKSIILAAAKIYAGFTVAKVVKDLRVKLLSALSLAEWKFFTNQPAGRLAASLMGESARGGKGYLTSLEILSSLVQITAYMIVAFFVSWEIVVLAAITSIILLVSLKKFININRHLGEDHTKLSRKINSQLIDSTRSIKSLKAMGRESHSNALIESYTKKLKSVAKKLKVSTELLSASQEIFLTIAIALCIYVAIYKLNTTIEHIIVLSILYIRTVKLTGKVQKQYQSFVADLSGFNGIMESINNAKNNLEIRSGAIKHTINGDIKLNNISFSHDNKSILKNTSAVIFHNKINTIIGESGAGKTTLVDLISGLYMPNSGEIYIDSISINEIDIHFWRSQIGYVVQDNTLLNTTIKGNVTLGDDKFSDQNVIDALTSAHANSFISQLDEGIYTAVGENGTKLSGGQRQRILIARALVHSPKLLILDEATSALDSDTENLLSEVFKDLSKFMTIVSISHRPALIEISDNIIELSNNKLNEHKT